MYFKGKLIFCLVILSSLGCEARQPQGGGSGSDQKSEFVRGELVGDLGKVILDGLESQELTHVFLLGNASDATLELEAIVPTCGCTSATTDQKQVAPGEELSIAVSLRIEEPGDKVEQVNVIFRDGRRVVLTIRAEGERMVHYQPVHVVVDLMREQSGEIEVLCISGDQQVVPSIQRVEAPAYVEVEVGQWSQTINTASFIDEVYARWRCKIRLSVRAGYEFDESLARWDDVRLECGSGQVFRASITGVPLIWH